MRDTLGEKIFNITNYFALALIGLSCLLPLLHVLSLSLSDASAIISGQVSFWPVGLSFEAYKSLFNGTDILRAFTNSVVITVVGTALSMLFTILAAYPLSRPYFYMRRPLTLAIVFTMMFSGGLIPNYLLIKALGLIDSYGAIWLPGLVSAYNMLVMKSFFENIPRELDDAARMDGCNEVRYVTSIVLPLSLPVIAALTLFYGVNFWNAFMNVMIYINDTAKLNLSVLVQQMVQSQSLLQDITEVDPDMMQSITPESIKAAAIFVMITPMLIVYPMLQKYFVKGVMIGAVKG
jgi:putative aldouronate transport system permease protein